jgi:predicted component of type VI protein secretion system
MEPRIEKRMEQIDRDLRELREEIRKDLDRLINWRLK